MSKASGSIDLKSLKVAGLEATGYITNIDNNGIFVHEYSTNNITPTMSGTNGIHISDDIDIIRDGSVVASYGTTATIGRATESNDYNIYIDSSSINLRKQDTALMTLSSNRLSLTDTINTSGNDVDTSLTIQKYFAIVSGNDSVIFNKARVDLATIDTPTKDTNTYTLSDWTGQVSENLKFYIGFTTYTTATGENPVPVKISFTKDISHSTSFLGITFSYNKNNNELSISASGDYYYGGNIYYLYNISRDSSPGYILGYLSDDLGLGKYSVSLGYMSEPLGYCSVAEGYSTQAHGNNSHAEGRYTTAKGYISHAEGSLTTASGDSSHAEGWGTTASHNYSHAEGRATTASGWASHAQGYDTKAQGYLQTVIGEYNNAQGTSSSRVNTDYVFIIGNGTSNSARSNALTVDWNGNVVANSFTGSLNGNATTSNVSIRATYASYYSSDTIGITGYSTNEINFVGTSTANGIYIGYRKLESPAISNYYFCNSTADSNGRGNIYCGALDTTGITISNTSLIYIVETGTSGSWRYVKWSDGRVELWGWFSQSVSAYAANAFVIGSTSVTAYPFTITEPKTIVSGQRINNGGCYVSYDYGRTDYWSGIANPTVGVTIAQGTTATVTWTCYVNARWK